MLTIDYWQREIMWDPISNSLFLVQRSKLERHFQRIFKKGVAAWANTCKNISLSSKKYLDSDKWWPTTIFLGWMSPIVKIVDQFESWPPWGYLSLLQPRPTTGRVWDYEKWLGWSVKWQGLKNCCLFALKFLSRFKWIHGRSSFYCVLLLQLVWPYGLH